MGTGVVVCGNVSSLHVGRNVMIRIADVQTTDDELYAIDGRCIDPDTPLCNNQHRHFDRTVGQWLSDDPISCAAGAILKGTGVVSTLHVLVSQWRKAGCVCRDFRSKPAARPSRP